MIQYLIQEPFDNKHRDGLVRWGVIIREDIFERVGRRVEGFTAEVEDGFDCVVGLADESFFDIGFSEFVHECALAEDEGVMGFD